MRRYPVCNASQTELVNVRFNACRWSWYLSLSHIEQRLIRTQAYRPTSTARTHTNTHAQHTKQWASRAAYKVVFVYSLCLLPPLTFHSLSLLTSFWLRLVPLLARGSAVSVARWADCIRFMCCAEHFCSFKRSKWRQTLVRIHKCVRASTIT